MSGSHDHDPGNTLWRRGLALGLLLWLVVAVGGAWQPLAAQTKAEAAPPPLSIALLVSSRPDLCFDPGDVGAITTLARREQERLNRQGGVAGRRVELKLLDDRSDADTAVANIRSALADPSTVAMIGLANSNRAKTAFDKLGQQIRESGIPFLSHIAVNSIFQGVPNVLTTQASQDEDRLPVMVQFIRRMNFARVAFVGLDDAVFSRGLGDGLKKGLGAEGVIADQRLRSASNEVLDPGSLAAAVADLKEKRPDLIVLGFGGKRVATLLTDLGKAGVTPSLFVAGQIAMLPPEIATSYPNAMYQLAWDRLPEADNDRLRQLLERDAPEDWVFEGRKQNEAAGWAAGKCEARPEAATPDPHEAANLRAIGTGARYADMVGLIAETARLAKPGTDIATLRRQALQQLTTTYAAGRGVFKGRFDNWAFQASTRTAVRTPFVVILPSGLGRTQLAPVQFVRIRDGSLRQIDTLYADIDLIRAHRVDDNGKTFSAEFYLSMRSGRVATVEQIEFTNAVLDPKTNGRQLTIEVLHGGGTSDAYPEGMRIYKVSGLFTFEPQLAGYPFDTQRFSIEMQPKRADQPFVVQPPPLDLRDKELATDGWTQKNQYVGYSEDFVPLLDAYSHQPSVVPFYKASFVWMMKRETTDYYLRVVVPLAFIMIVAYLSYFIGTMHFEAIVTIQVTALLSAVALYLSLPKLDSDAATLSDRIFVFNYMIVSVMIVVTILRINPFAAGYRWIKGALSIIHVAGIPAMVAAMAIYVWRLTEM